MTTSMSSTAWSLPPRARRAAGDAGVGGRGQRDLAVGAQHRLDHGHGVGGGRVVEAEDFGLVTRSAFSISWISLIV